MARGGALVTLVVCISVGAGGWAERAESPASAAVVAAPLAVVWHSSSPPLLARLDPLSLQVIPPQLELVEYHYAYSFSPDGRLLALGLQARVGVRIVDLARMQVAHDVPMPIAVEALAWLEPRRLIAVTQSGDVALVDPATGKVLVRRSLPLAPQCTPSPQTSARTRLGLVLVLADNLRVAPARVAVIDARGRTRVAVLRRMLAGPVGTVCGRAGLAVDLTRARAYVVAPGGLVAAVDLRTMHVRYHAVSAKRPASRDAVWLGNGRFAFASNGAVTLTPAGATVVDAERWSSRIIDPRAGAIQVADGKLLTYEGIRASGPSGGTGVHAYRFDGSELWHLFDGEHVVDVQNANGYLYVRTAQSTHVVDAGSGAVVADLGPVAGYLGFLAPDR